jgi:CHAD domain-containing protein
MSGNLGGKSLSYRLHSSESLEVGLKRIAGEQLDLARSGFDEAELDRYTAVHEARKCCKRLRGLLRLARAGVGDGVYRLENDCLRDAARRLSDLRDAEALIETYDKLDARFDSQIDRRTIAPVRRALAARRQIVADDEATLERRVAAFREDLEAGHSRVSSWVLAGGGFDALAAGLKRTYKRGRKAMGTAYATPSAEHFHDWRKRVKYHRYHLEVLYELWPKQLKARRSEVKTLGTMLGDEHDLSVLEATLEAESASFGDESVRTLLDLALRRRAELRAGMSPLGRRVFAERPKAMVRRYEAYWGAWRSEAADGGALGRAA